MNCENQSRFRTGSGRGIRFSHHCHAICDQV